MVKVGFIGLGIMGRPMAKNLAAKGCSLVVHDVVPSAVAELVAAGAEKGSVETIAETCPIVFTILPSGTIVKDVLFGEGGLAARMPSGGIVADLSSVTPAESRFCAEGLAGKGIAFMDAPVSGGEPKAIDGTLAFMAGGDRKTFDALQPYFLKMGASAILVGGHGDGSVAKLANQIIVNNTIAVVSEAFVFAAKAGADPLKVYEAIKGGLAASAVLNAKLPMIVERNFRPGGKISINHKDLKNVLATAHEIDTPVPYSAQLFEILQGLKVAGQLDEDHGSIVKHFERLAGTEVRKKG